MKRLAKTALSGLHTAVIVGALLALTLSGAGAAQRLFADQMTPPPVKNLPDGLTFDAPPVADDATGGMDTGSRPSTEQSFWIQGNPALPVGSDHSHRLTTAPALAKPVADRVLEGAPLCQSTGLVASQIGHRFTLVGSRPSGTS